jgi:hypothetical protein
MSDEDRLGEIKGSGWGQVHLVGRTNGDADQSPLSTSPTSGARIGRKSVKEIRHGGSPAGRNVARIRNGRAARRRRVVKCREQHVCNGFLLDLPTTIDVHQVAVPDDPSDQRQDFLCGQVLRCVNAPVPSHSLQPESPSPP